MIRRIVVAVAIGVGVFLICLLGGVILVSLDVPTLKEIGKFLQQWAVVIGVIGAALAFFTGWNPFGGRAA